MKLDPSAIATFREHVLEVYPNEAAGFIVNGQFIACDNIHEDPANHFRVANENFLRYSKAGLQAVVHSHVKPVELILSTDPRAPSREDMAGQIATALPWGIAACDGTVVSDILWWGGPEIAPLVGRSFIHGVYDCYSLARDWYKLNEGIDLPDFPRRDEWWASGENLYLDHMEEAGFVVIPLKDLQPADSVLMAIRSPVPNHGAVYVGDVVIDGQVIKEQLLQHLFTRQSGYDLFAKWRPAITHVLRHKSFIAPTIIGEPNAS